MLRTKRKFRVATALTAAAALLCSGCVFGDKDKASSLMTSSTRSDPAASAVSDESVLSSERSAVSPSSRAVSSARPSSSKKPASSAASSRIAVSDNVPAAQKDLTDVRPPEIKPADYQPVSPEKYRMYGALTEAEKHTYRMIVGMAETMYGLSEKEKSAPLAVGRYPDQTAAVAALEKVIHAVRSDYPQIFWLPSGYVYAVQRAEDGVELSVSFHYFDAQKGEYKIRYPMTKEERDAKRARLQAAAKEIADRVGGGLGEFEREEAVFRLLCERIAYDTETYARAVANGGYLSDDMNPDAFTAYGALVNQTAVCEGYARAFQYLMYAVGIECTLVTGSSASPNSDQNVYTAHMWNAVKIEGKWYQTDVTWADLDRLDKQNRPLINFEFFNLPDSYMKLTHAYDPEYPARNGDSFNFALPVCDSADANYNLRKGTFVDGADGVEIRMAEILVAHQTAGVRQVSILFDPGVYESLKPLLNGEAFWQQVLQNTKSAGIRSLNRSRGRYGMVLYW